MNTLIAYAGKSRAPDLPLRAMMKKLTGRDTDVDNLQWHAAKQLVEEVK